MSEADLLLLDEILFDAKVVLHRVQRVEFAHLGDELARDQTICVGERGLMT